MTCLLSGGFDSAVAAYKMMKRGAHLSFVHFWAVARGRANLPCTWRAAWSRNLVPYQFPAKLYLVPFEPIQREIVRYAPESYRILLYRRMMLRIAERFARRDQSLALVTGDSLGQVASQTLHNMVAVGAAARMPLFRPLVGDDKMEITRHGAQNRHVRYFRRTVPRLLPRFPAAHSRAVRQAGRTRGSRIQARYSRAG